MKKAHAKAMLKTAGIIAKRIDCDCCNFRGGCCTVLNDTEYLRAIVNDDCGNVGCPFYKPEENLVRVGDNFFTQEGYQKYLRMTVRVRWIRNRLDKLNENARRIALETDRDIGKREGIEYAVDYLTREINRLKIEEGNKWRMDM